MFRISYRVQSATFVALAALLFAIPATAQLTNRSRRQNATRQARIARNIQSTYSHRWEINGGGGFLRFHSGEFLQRNTEVNWTTGLAYNLNPRLSVVGDIRGYFGHAKIGNNLANLPTNANPLITEYTFLAGPQYRLYRKEKLSISVSGLGGVSLGNFDGGTHGIAAFRLGMWDTSNRPALSANVNFDYNLFPNFAVRIAPTYVGTLFRGATLSDPDNINSPRGATVGSVQNNVGINFGIVYRFGRQ